MQNVDIVNVSGSELSLVDLDDGALLTMARAGHQEAYATLFGRYSYAAHRLARHLGQKEDSDDVVSEAFAQVLDLLGRGKGPETAFRAYLFTTVRHECARRAKARKRVMPTDDLRQIDTPVAFGNGDLDSFERSTIRAAYESLPPRWRTVLWHLDVEGRKPHELGPLLDMSPNSVSALVYRARAGLREAYLQQHVKDEQPDDSRLCSDHRAKLSSFVRRTASARDQERIHAHLESCSSCMAIYLDLQEVNREVGMIAAPAAVATVLTVSMTSVGAHLTMLLKALLSVLVPSAAAAAVASATLVAAPSPSMAEPGRRPLAISAAPLTTTPQAAAPSPAAPSSGAPSGLVAADDHQVTAAGRTVGASAAAPTTSAPRVATPRAAEPPSRAPAPGQAPLPAVTAVAGATQPVAAAATDLAADVAAAVPDVTQRVLPVAADAVSTAIDGLVAQPATP